MGGSGSGRRRVVVRASRSGRGGAEVERVEAARAGRGSVRRGAVWNDGTTRDEMEKVLTRRYSGGAIDEVCRQIHAATRAVWTVQIAEWAASASAEERSGAADSTRRSGTGPEWEPGAWWSGGSTEQCGRRLAGCGGTWAMPRGAVAAPTKFSGADCADAELRGGRCCRERPLPMNNRMRRAAVKRRWPETGPADARRAAGRDGGGQRGSDGRTREVGGGDGGEGVEVPVMQRSAHCRESVEGVQMAAARTGWAQWREGQRGGSVGRAGREWVRAVFKGRAAGTAGTGEEDVDGGRGKLAQAGPGIETPWLPAAALRHESVGLERGTHVTHRKQTPGGSRRQERWDALAAPRSCVGLGAWLGGHWGAHAARSTQHGG